MNRLETLRAALSAIDPSLALDAFVRRELTAGRTPLELYDELKADFAQVSAWPEYHGEAEADWHGMMDALRGWCHPACRYEVPADLPASPVTNGHPVKDTARV